MKKIALLLAVSVCLMFGGSNAWAQEAGGEKLRVGAIQVLSSPLELGKKTAYYTSNVDFKPLGFFAGILEGSGGMLGKMLTGFVNILTFPFPNDC